MTHTNKELATLIEELLRYVPEDGTEERDLREKAEDAITALRNQA